MVLARYALTRSRLSELYDSYSSFGDTAKPKISIRYKPFDDLTFRASYSESFRAPSVEELFTGPLEAFTFVVDPVTQTQPEVGIVTVGNPKLKPETGYGCYAGVVWSPGSADPEHSRGDGPTALPSTPTGPKFRKIVSSPRFRCRTGR